MISSLMIRSFYINQMLFLQTKRRVIRKTSLIRHCFIAARIILIRLVRASRRFIFVFRHSSCTGITKKNNNNNTTCFRYAFKKNLKIHTKRIAMHSRHRPPRHHYDLKIFGIKIFTVFLFRVSQLTFYRQKIPRQLFSRTLICRQTRES